MAQPTIAVDGSIWKVYPTGRITVYGKDEFGLLFELGTGPERKRRFTRYSPLGSKSSDASLAELQLLHLRINPLHARLLPIPIRSGKPRTVAYRELRQTGHGEAAPVVRRARHDRAARALARELISQAVRRATLRAQDVRAELAA